MKNGSLVVVGTGHKVTAQITPEAATAIRRADKVFYAVDPATSAWIQGIHPCSESLVDSYAVGKHRRDTYEQIVERILSPVRKGLKVCAVFYGHPGVLSSAAHQAIRRARMERFNAEMLPAVSTEDCLWADIEVDPSSGCQSFEASDFLIFPRRLDTLRPLVLWQIGLIGIGTYYSKTEAWNPHGIRALAEALQSLYPPAHRVIVYESAPFPGFSPAIQSIPLARLPAAPITVRSILYVPPVNSPSPVVLQTPKIGRRIKKRRMPRLAVVGLGYRVSAEVTTEALSHICRSDKLFFLVYDPVTEGWLMRMKPGAVSLQERISQGSCWPEVVDEVVSAVTGGQYVCMAFSGHPAVCLTPSYEAAKRARWRGFMVSWVPGISAADCLYADVGLDPADHGCQLFQAAALIDLQPFLDARVPLIILQAGVVRGTLLKLRQFLHRYYQPHHKIVLYEAAVFPTCDPIMRRVSLSSLSEKDLTFCSTLYIPPSGSPPADYQMLSRLGIK